MKLAVNSFMEMTSDEMMLVDGGVNWDRVFAGSTVYLSATMAICAMTGPIGWGTAIAYWGICAACGAYIGYGLGSK